MSRIGNKTITIPAGVELNIAAGNEVTVKGPKGTLSRHFRPEMDIELDAGIVTVKRPDETKLMKQIHGTTRSLINNMIVGVTEGFTKELELVGIGYRASVAGDKLVLNIGFSHPVEFDIVAGLEVETPKATEIKISGTDKQVVGEFAANVRATRKPEPYLGKGIKYKGEHIARKEGKTAASKG